MPYSESCIYYNLDTCFSDIESDASLSTPKFKKKVGSFIAYETTSGEFQGEQN